tara:strand:- start:1956 stop:2444 length:489 start_codon:yes stop_codon:yes gene_type:complete
MSVSDEKKQVCKEYNALKYKTMIMTGENMDKNIVNETNEATLHSFLMQERINNKKQSWNKLSKTYKIQKLQSYVNSTLKDEHELNEEECVQTMSYFKTLLERKKLHKNSDLDYDEENGEIRGIQIILFNTNNRKFTLNKEIKTVSKKTKTVKKKSSPNKIEK